MTFPVASVPVEGAEVEGEPMSADVRLVSPATTPGCFDEEKCLTETLPNGTSIRGCRQKWSVTPRWYLVPVWTIALSAVQIMIYALANDRVLRLLRFEPVLRWEVWRFFSYTLVHWGALHLALNVLVQCVVASPLEVEQGGPRTTAVYVGGGFVGALGACVFQPQPMVGASAGIYAVLVSHLAHLYLNLSGLKYKLYRIFCVLVLSGSDVIFCVLHTRSEGYPSISLSAHALGGVAGLLLGIVIYQGEDPGQVGQVKVVRVTAAAISTVLVLMGVVTVCLLPSNFFRR